MFHHVDAAYLRRYLGEFQYRFNQRKVSDEERFASLMGQNQGALWGTAGLLSLRIRTLRSLSQRGYCLAQVHRMQRDSSALVLAFWHHQTSVSNMRSLC